MLHTEELTNELAFNWCEWYSTSPVTEELEQSFSQELRDDCPSSENRYYLVRDDENELLLIKTSSRGHRINLHLARTSDCNAALCLRNALEEEIVPKCLADHMEIILAPNVQVSLREVFERLATLHENEPIEGVTRISPVSGDSSARIFLRSTLRL